MVFKTFVYYDSKCYNGFEGESSVLDVFLPPSLQPLVNNVKLIKISGRTLGECLDNLARQYPPLETALFDKNHAVQKGFSFYFNGENATSRDFLKPVKDGDKLYIINILVGG